MQETEQTQEIKVNQDLKLYMERFRNMKPYFYIGPDEWEYIKNTWEKEEVRDAITDVLIEYDFPYADISEKDAFNEYLKLKAVRWHEHYIETPWHARNSNNYKFPLTFDGTQKIFKSTLTGNKASNHFQQRNRMTVGARKFEAPAEGWLKRKYIRILTGGFYSLKYDRLDRVKILSTIQMKHYVCSQFKPSVAKMLYDKFGAKTILDFSMGWGDRLCGFFASNTGEHYVGLDPRTENHPIYHKQAEWYSKYKSFFEPEKRYTFHESPAEDFDFSQYPDYFDMVFTSPPYFNVEKYSNDESQSWIRYDNVTAWNKNFLHKALGNMIPATKPGGHIAVNIADVTVDAKYAEIINPMYDFMESQGMKYVGTIGMEMAKRPNEPGANNKKLKSEMEDVDETSDECETFCDNLEPVIEDTPESKFVEPIFIWQKPLK